MRTTTPRRLRRGGARAIEDFRLLPVLPRAEGENLALGQVEVTMTKLAQWLWGLALLGSTWAALTMGALGLELPSAYREVLWPLPAYLLVSAGCYALGTVGYRVATFHDCEDAARELQSQILEARADLARRGMRF
ncbi:Dolichol-phosphate mannosyltransferase subunit 3 [Galemys pyrenaicus]|uniref:Dolichol-phosphate mannosyltransferase subunit 3 n=1 Tax=Galemys pyrenaicus TaxID=202257 RepID=A0A8J6B5E4_GALPY|nr:Dolichol-phosphate mannosyltransferase subunit 3 [Galemys pyrenaicus]